MITATPPSSVVARTPSRRGARGRTPRWSHVAAKSGAALAICVWIAAAGLSLTPIPTAQARGVDEVHYTFTGPRSVAFDWRGPANRIRYGRTAAYGTGVTAATPDPVPFSSDGPFWEARLRGLAPGTTYHYSIGRGPDGTFHTAPIGRFRFDAMGDVGSSLDRPVIPSIDAQIAADRPSFVIVAGDITYADSDGQQAVDQHFNDVMAWSQRAAYVPAWGNHDWDAPDDLRNYKGRFALPHDHRVAGAPAAGCCGEDWSWFDAGSVRFISYPEPYDDATWQHWAEPAKRVMAHAQSDPSIHFIVTFGHRPAYSTGHHVGDPALSSILNGFGEAYPKYVLNLNAHSHDYERFRHIHGVTHLTASGGGYPLEPPWSTTDPRTAYRAMHLATLRVDVSASAMRLQAVCGPATDRDETRCSPGTVIDSKTIKAR